MAGAAVIAVQQFNGDKKLTIMNLYYHKTDGGAEYLTDTFIEWSHKGKSGKEGTFKGAKYIVRIDGDITKDAELTVVESKPTTKNKP